MKQEISPNQDPVFVIGIWSTLENQNKLAIAGNYICFFFEGSIKLRIFFVDLEDNDDYKPHIQMDLRVKKLFTIKNPRPIIDFINAIYGDDISYDAKITYSDKEIVFNSPGGTYKTW